MNKLRYLFFAFWVGTILFLSLVPVPQVDAPNNIDKVVHFLMYFLTSLVFYLTFHKKFLNVVINALIFSVLLGTFIEILQHFVPYRGFSFGDILANCFGALCGSFSISFFRKPLVQINNDNQERVE